MISQDCISDGNMTDGMAGDDTSGKKGYTKAVYTMNLHLHMHLQILNKWTEMSKNIVLTYVNI